MNQSASDHHTIGGVVIDGFRFGTPTVKAYILTHFHSDHHQGLHASYAFAPGQKLYCTAVTAALVSHVLDVPARHVEIVAFDAPVRLSGGVSFTFVPANHCPGSAMVLFELTSPRGEVRRILHTGDARLAASLTTNPSLFAARGTGGIDEVRLDTTYAHPKHTFPPQEECVDQALQLLEEVAELVPAAAPPLPGAGAGAAAASPFHTSPRTLILVSAYVIGKERLFMAIARHFHMKIYVSADKQGVLRCLGLPPEDLRHLTTNRVCADIHIVGMGTLGSTHPYFRADFDAMKKYLAAMNRAHGSGSGGGVAAGGIGSSASASASSSAKPAIPPYLRGGPGSAAATAVVDEEEEDAWGEGGDLDAEDKELLQLHGGASSCAAASAAAPRYSRVVGICPTGWVNSVKDKRLRSPDATAEVILTPYSEHSSFTELEEFMRWLKPARIWPTVYSDDADRDRIAARFARYTNQTAAKRTFLAAFGAGVSASASQQQQQQRRSSSSSDSAAASVPAVSSSGASAATSSSPSRQSSLSQWLSHPRAATGVGTAAVSAPLSSGNGGISTATSAAAAVAEDDTEVIVIDDDE